MSCLLTVIGLKFEDVSTRASNCLPIAIQNYHKEINRKQFCNLGKTFINRVVAQFQNHILQDSKPKHKIKIKK